ncbi:MAG: hypothetical protein NC110_08205 [Ruminococcus sp.]|nr:hypothetical protein [Ruminococcus sp.]
MLKKKRKIVAVVAVIVALAASFAYVVARQNFISTTVGDIDEYCAENTYTKATTFYQCRFPQYPGYVFAIPEDGDEDKQSHELFYFREDHFGSHERYIPSHASGSPSAPVNDYNFYKHEELPNVSKICPMFYSSNEIGAARLEYTYTYEENGNEVTIKTTADVSPDKPYIVACKEFNADPPNTFETSLKLYDKNSKLIYES